MGRATSIDVLGHPASPRACGSLFCSAADAVEHADAVLEWQMNVWVYYTSGLMMVARAVL